MVYQLVSQPGVQMIWQVYLGTPRDRPAPYTPQRRVESVASDWSSGRSCVYPSCRQYPEEPVQYGRHLGWPEI